VNAMAANLTGQVRNIAEVTTAWPRRSVEEDHGGREGRDPGAEEHHQHDVTSSCVSGEVTRVAREVGTRAKLGARRRCREWLEL